MKDIGTDVWLMTSLPPLWHSKRRIAPAESPVPWPPTIGLRRVSPGPGVTGYLCVPLCAAMSNLISIYKPARNLRSSKAFLLTPVPSNFVRLGDRAFSTYAPKIWKKIPSYIKESKSLDTFKTKLKTHFFTIQQ